MPYTQYNEGGIFESNGHYIEHSSFTHPGGLHKKKIQLPNNSETRLTEIAEEQHIDISSVTPHHSTAVYIGILTYGWGHFITDCMRLVWFLRSNEYRENFSDCPLVYIPANEFELEDSWKRLLEILGVNISLMTPVTELTRYDEIILPDECFFMSNGTFYFTAEYAEITGAVRDFALNHSKPLHAEKIYYSCAKYPRGAGARYSEERLEEYFASKGYEIIAPEKLSLDDQLNALVHCKSFASTIGSSSHNSVFLRDNTEVILIPRANYLTVYQLAINQVHPQNIHYIDSSFSIFNSKIPVNGPFFYFISSNLRKYFHDEDTESIIYPSDFWKYLRAVFGMKFSHRLSVVDFGIVEGADNPEAYRYYSTTAAEYFGKLIKMSRPYRFRMWLKKLLRRKKLTQ